MSATPRDRAVIIVEVVDNHRHWTCTVSAERPDLLRALECSVGKTLAEAGEETIPDWS